MLGSASVKIPKEPKDSQRTNLIWNSNSKTPTHPILQVRSRCQPAGGPTEYFRRTTRGATGIYHPDTRTAKYGVLASQHLIVGCGQVYYEAPPLAKAEDLSENGHYSVHKIRAKSPNYADAIEKGFEVFIIDWRVRILSPMALCIMAQGGNSDNHCMAPEWEHSVLLNMWGTAAKELDSGRDADWGMVSRMAFCNKPPCEDVKKELLEFCMLASGASKEDGASQEDWRAPTW